MSDHIPDTYYGLERIVTGPGEVIKYLEEAVQQVRRKGFFEEFSKKRHVGDPDHSFKRAYPYIFLADTFLTDTWDINLQKALFDAAKASSSGPPEGEGHPAIPCEILLLNPFSDQARVRTIMLEAEIAQNNNNPLPFQQRFIELRDNWGRIERNRKEREIVINEVLPKALWRTCQGILKLYAVLSAFNKNVTPTFELPITTDDFERRQLLSDGIRRLRDLMKQLRDEKRLHLEVRFTSELMVLPFYIIGPHVFKGVLMPRSSAVNKPWSIYRDDPKRNYDTFEVTFETFKQAWESAITIDDLESDVTEDTVRRTAQGNLKTGILVAYSEANKAVLNVVKSRLTSLSSEEVHPLEFSDESGAGTFTKETVQKLIDQASAGIAIMFPDENIPTHQLKHESQPRDQVKRCRQNIVHELGLMQGTYGWNRVLVICAAGEKIEMPSNLNSMHVARVRLDSNGAIDEPSLDGFLQKFLRDLKKHA